MGKKLARQSHERSDSGDSDDKEDSEEVLYAGAVNMPAHQTKHLAQLDYTFPSIGITFAIAQSNESHNTGSSLWLSSQVLSSYLIHISGKRKGSTFRKAIELGSGTGLLSLLLAKCDWRVLATDLATVIESVLQPNVTSGLKQIRADAACPEEVIIHELDWEIEPTCWTWNSDGPSTGKQTAGQHSAHLKKPDFDLIVTADTLYESTILRPLLRTLSFLYHEYSGSGKPTVLLALERRDEGYIDAALCMATDEFNLPFRRIPPRQVRKIFDQLGDGKSWSRQDWEGVEIWKI